MPNRCDCCCVDELERVRQWKAPCFYCALPTGTVCFWELPDSTDDPMSKEQARMTGLLSNTAECLDGKVIVWSSGNGGQARDS
jgi:hypothetical protein